MIKKIRSRDNNDIFSFVITVVISIIIFSLSGRMLGGDYTVCQGDYFGTLIPSIKLIFRKIFDYNDLWDNGRMLYSFSCGLGDDISVLYTSFFSPFNIVFLLIKNIYVAASLVLCLKLGLASFCFYKFSSKVLNARGVFVVVFATIYGLCGYVLNAYINVQFLDGLYMLPVLMTCLLEFITYNKCYRLILCLSFLFIVNFYAGYIIGIFLALVFLITVIMKGDKGKVKGFCRFDIRYIFNKCIKMFISVIISMLISASILVPAMYAILNNISPDRTILRDNVFNVLTVLGSLFITVYSNVNETFPALYSGIIPIIFVIFFFLSKSVNKDYKKCVTIIIVFLLLCLLTKPFYLLMHCFDAPDGYGFRFAYIISFVIISVAVYMWDKISEISNTNKIACIFAIGILVTIIWCIKTVFFSSDVEGYSLLGLELNIIFMLIYVFILIKFEKYKKMLLIVMVAETLLNGYMTQINQNYYVFSNKDIREKCLSQQEEALKLINDDSFFRIYIKNATSNAPLLYGYKSLSFFSSPENYRIRQALHLFGYMSTPRYLTDYGSTALMRMLMADKYSVDVYGVIRDNDIECPQIHVEPYYLSIGYMASSTIEELEYSMEEGDINPFDNQNKLISALTGEEIEVYTESDGILNGGSENISIEYLEDMDEYLVVLDDSSTIGSITFTLDENKDGVFAYFPQEVSSLNLNSPILISPEGDTGYLMTNSSLGAPHILEIGRNDKDLYEVKLIINNSMDQKYGVINDMYYYIQNDDEIFKAYNLLKDNQLILDEVQDGYIKGHIEVDLDKNVMVTSVPYSDYWEIYIDDDRVDSTSVINGAFLAVHLDAGVHVVEMKYRNPWQILGLGLSILGIVSYMILIMLEKKNY